LRRGERLCRLAQERFSAHYRYQKSSLKRKWLVGGIWLENSSAVEIKKRNGKDEGKRIGLGIAFIFYLIYPIYNLIA